MQDGENHGTAASGGGIAAVLLAWYATARRDLPWRAKPGERADPYKVWLSEIMLQQTTVRAVIPYYQEFLRRWRDVAALAAAPLDDILRAWAGLGYYARARNLHQCAREIVANHGGRFPETEEKLRELPGIGDYTAAAIAAIAFGRRATVVDSNVERVVARLYAIETPLPKAKAEIRQRAEMLTPVGRSGDFAQAMMDLGASVCSPREPACLLCPLGHFCAARMRGLAAGLPVRAGRPDRPTRRGAAFFVLRADGKVLLRRRQEKGLLGGMMEVPTSSWVEGEATGDLLTQAPLKAKWSRVHGHVQHSFTHFHLVLEVYCTMVQMSAAAKLGGGDYRWVGRRDLGAEALPTLMRKVVAHALEGMMVRGAAE